MDKYARREPTTDWYIGKYGHKAMKYDVQIYDDEKCTSPYARFMWYQRKPTRASKRVTVNCFTWGLVWVSPKGETSND